LRLTWLIRLLGVDQAISYSLASKAFSAVAQPAALFFVASMMSSAEQGYYYTFGSVLALTALIELGLGVVLTHFLSNEFAALQWSASGMIVGDAGTVGRWLSVVRQALGWYAGIAITIVLLVGPAGLAFFSAHESTRVNFEVPWLTLVFAAAIGTWQVPLIAALASSGRLAELQRLRLAQNVVGATVLCSMLSLGAGLYSLALMQWAQVLIFAAWFGIAYQGLVAQLSRYREGDSHTTRILWREEILPFQWRVAISSAVIHLTTFTAAPLLFAYRGATAAGQLGMSKAFADLIAESGRPWVSSRAVTYGGYVGRREFELLDGVAFRSTVRGLGVSSFVGLVAIIAVAVAREFDPSLAERMLSLSDTALFVVAGIAGLAIASLGEYLRAYKREPLLMVHIVLAVAMTTANYVSARWFDASMMAKSNALVVLLVGLPLAAGVFWVKRLEMQRALGGHTG
jgi:hypothetical protein